MDSRGKNVGPRDDRADTTARLAAAIADIERRGTSTAPSAGPDEARRSGSAPDEARRSGSAPDEAASGTDHGQVTEAKNLCLRWLAARARSRHELATRLAARDLPVSVINAALDRLQALGLIDDAAFAAEFVRAKHRSHAWGPGALRAGLRAKGIAPQLIDQALSGLDSDAQRERAAALVQSRLDAAVFAGLPTARRRLLALLARRGYPSSVSISVINDALHGYVDQMDDPGGD